MTLRSQLAILLLLVTFIPIVVTTYQIEQKTSEEYVSLKDASLTYAGKSVVNLFDGYIRSSLETLHADAHIPVFRKFLEGDQAYRQQNLAFAHEMLKNVVVKDAIFVSSAAILDIQGNIVLDSSFAYAQKNELEFPYFRRSLDKLNGYFSSSLTDLNSHQSLYAASPIKNISGNTIGLLRLRIEPGKIQLILNKALKSSEFSSSVIDDSGVVIANLLEPDRIGKQRASTDLKEIVDPQWLSVNDQRIRLLRFPLKTTEWMVEVSLSEKEYLAKLDRNFQDWLFKLVVVFLVTLLGVAWLASIFIKPIRKLEVAADRIASGDYQQTLPVEGSEEVKRLANSFKKMLNTILSSMKELEVKNNAKNSAERALIDLSVLLEQKVEQRTNELLTANKEKGEAIEQLVHAEKMAELGQLVAGVTHEVNTPLGNNVTVASTLSGQVESFRKQVADGRVSKSSLDQFLNDCGYASEILQRNCTRANDLMGSFKQVAVDQTSLRLRQFELHKSVEEVLMVLHGFIKNRHVEFDIDIPLGLKMNNYPGAFDQVVTNLVNNSLIHGIPEDTIGQIKFKAYLDDKDGDEIIAFEYQDNGIGISAEIADQIFDPFFTTRGEDVGSGMGLYLIKSIVEKEMKGQVSLDRDFNDGARFVFRFAADIEKEEG